MLSKYLKYNSLFIVLLIVTTLVSCTKGDEPSPVVSDGNEGSSQMMMRSSDVGEGDEDNDVETIIGGDDNEDDDSDAGTVIGGGVDGGSKGGKGTSPILPGSEQ